MNYYTARRLRDMVESLGRLARAFDDGIEKNGQLAKDDGLATMQANAILMCENCSGCNPYVDNEKKDSYYLYYLLRASEQKGHIDFEDMPQMLQSGCRKKEGCLTQLSQNLGGAIMNLPWKNRFLKGRDTVIPQFRELLVILEEFSYQIDRTRNITDKYEHILRKHFRHYHVALENSLFLEYENGQKEASLMARTINDRCITSRDATLVMGEVMDEARWSPTKDNRSIITKQYETVRLPEEGGCRMLYGASRIPEKGEKYSGDNYTFCEDPGNQMVMSLSDRVGSGEVAAKESKQMVGLAEQLLETGSSPRATSKLMSTVSLLAGPEQHPATLDLGCIDLHTGVLEAMKLGAVPAFAIGEEGMEIMEVGEVSMGVLNGVEPVPMSRRLQEGDRVVVVSDGVLDALPGDDKEQAMQQYLESVKEMEPRGLTGQMLDFTVSFISVPRNDIAVLAAGIWKRRS